MTLFRQRVANLDALSDAAGMPRRFGSRSGPRGASQADAMRHSAVWACRRLRANLVSSLPIDQFRMVDGIQVEIPNKPQVLTRPGALHIGGQRATISEWLYATQMELDGCGNTFGLVIERDGLGLPSRIDLFESSGVKVLIRKTGEVRYRVGNKEYSALDIWHERQYVVAGLPIGLSPLAYAAYTIGQYLSAQEFAMQWFDGGGKPAAKMKNTARVLTTEQALAVKSQHEATTTGGGVLVFGKDWEYDMIGADASATSFLETQRFSVADVCRFMDTPADMIDAGTSGSSVTYANIGQRMVSLLVTSIGPAVKRREDTLSTLTSQPRFVKLNTDALLRMDPYTQAQVLGLKVTNRALTPDEWRALDNRPPLTQDQIDTLAELFGRTPPPTAAQPAQGSSSS
ncbi:phage portal protein [Angustibacter luteus]|uniref:Phage portal protein n=1 Tax=Angustibacter luteus TaxID=658456 RepID=A0ABW1JJT0_9ACTN